MANYITKIRTISGDLSIDYNGLANLPDLDVSFSEVDKKIKSNSDSIETINEAISDINDSFDELDKKTKSNSDSIETINESISDISGSVTEINGAIEEINGAIDATNDAIEGIKDSKSDKNHTHGSVFNLLDNSNFAKPVNQQNQIKYEKAGMHIDRWKTGYSTLVTELKSGYINLTFTHETANFGGFFQVLPEGVITAGKKYTMAIMDGNGTIYSTVATAPSTTGTAIFGNIGAMGQFEMPYTNDGYRFQISVNKDRGMNIIWAALYEGVFTTETLPNYVVKDYAEELLVCRQYDMTTGKYIGLQQFATPHNLLDNSNFAKPVNQRNKTSYAATGYCIDRWWNSDASLTVGFLDGAISLINDSTTLIPFIAHKFDAKQSALMQGKKYTIAACDVDGNILIANGTITTGTVESNTSMFNSGSASDAYYLSMYKRKGDDAILEVRINIRQSKGVYLKWAALYEGQYTVDTLPAYVPKGYGEELAECQRHYIEFANVKTNGYVTDSSKTYCMPLWLPCQMRVTPSIIVDNNLKWRGRTANGPSEHTSSNYTAFKNASVEMYGNQIILKDVVASGSDPSDTAISFEIQNVRLSAEL